MIESFRDFAPTETEVDLQCLAELNPQLKAFLLKDLQDARDSVIDNTFLAYSHVNIAMLNSQICANRPLWEHCNHIRNDIAKGLLQMAHQELVNLCSKLS